MTSIYTMSFFSDDPALVPKRPPGHSSYPIPKTGEPVGLNYQLWFGKYEGWKIGDVLKVNHKYILWCCDNKPGFQLTNNALSKAIEYQDAEDDLLYGPIDTEPIY